jgi:hypothetical protein
VLRALTAAPDASAVQARCAALASEKAAAEAQLDPAALDQQVAGMGCYK